MSTNQPAAALESKPPPDQYKTIYLAWGVLLAVTLGLGIYFSLIEENRVVYQKTHDLQPLNDGNATHVVFSDPIELNPRQNLMIKASAPVDNSWAWVGGDFINEETGSVEEFELPVELYYGVEGGESWTEGGGLSELFISSLPKGRYTLRLEFQWERFNEPMPISVIITQRVARPLHMGLTLLGISILPLYLYMRQLGWFGGE